MLIRIHKREQRLCPLLKGRGGGNSGLVQGTGQELPLAEVETEMVKMLT